MSIGERLNNFVLRKEINKVVFLAEDLKTNRMYVAKVCKIAKDQKKSEAFDEKLLIAVGKQSPYITDYLDIVTREKERFVFMCHFLNGDLKAETKRRVVNKEYYEEDEILQFLFEVASGLKALHGAKIIHHHLKLTNIFVEDNLFKISDYGISQNVGGSDNGYIAIEVLNGEKSITTAQDVYSLGCMLLEIIDLSNPFSLPDGSIAAERALQQKINEPGRPLNPLLKAIRDFALRMLIREPSKRPTIDDILAFPLVLLYSHMRQKFAPGLSFAAKAIERKKVYPSSSSSSSSSRIQLPCVVRYFPNPHGGFVLGGTKDSAGWGAGSSSSSSSSNGGGGGSAAAAGQKDDYHHPPLTPNPTESEGDTSSRIEVYRSLGEFDVAFTGEKKRTLCFEIVLVQGIWKLVIAVSNYDSKNMFSFGVIRPSDVENCLKGVIGHKSATGLGYNLWSDCASIENNDASTTTVSADYKGLDDAQLAVEVDMDKRTLYFFNAGKQIPYSITRLPSSLQFGFSSSCGQHVVRYVSLERIVAPTANTAVGCETLEWMNILR